MNAQTSQTTATLYAGSVLSNLCLPFLEESNSVLQGSNHQDQNGSYTLVGLFNLSTLFEKYRDESRV